MTSGSLGAPYGVSTAISSMASRKSYSPEPPITPMLARSELAKPELARSEPATAVQATFEPDEDDPEEEDDDPEEEEEEEEDDDDEELPTLSPDFLSPELPEPDLSPAADESDFFPSEDPFDPLAEAPAGSLVFWLARLSVR
jgi:hypothetical protein